jgi:predicted amidohydrolase YtcJ
MILSNGRIYTLDGQDRVVDTLLVRAGRIAFAGRRRDLNAPVGEQEIDLGGRAVLPGLVDAHGHLMYLARLRLTLDVAGLTSETACAERVAARAATLPAGAWIAGRGWDQTGGPAPAFPPGRHSTARRPVIRSRWFAWTATRSGRVAQRCGSRASIGAPRIRREGGSSATLGGSPPGC